MISGWQKTSTECYIEYLVCTSLLQGWIDFKINGLLIMVVQEFERRTRFIDDQSSSEPSSSSPLSVTPTLAWFRVPIPVLEPASGTVTPAVPLSTSWIASWLTTFLSLRLRELTAGGDGRWAFLILRISIISDTINQQGEGSIDKWREDYLDESYFHAPWHFSSM